MNNLVRHICEFTCSPHQSTFINVANKKFNPVNNSELNTAFAVDHANLQLSSQKHTSTGLIFTSPKNTWMEPSTLAKAFSFHLRVSWLSIWCAAIGELQDVRLCDGTASWATPAVLSCHSKSTTDRTRRWDRLMALRRSIRESFHVMSQWM